MNSAPRFRHDCRQCKFLGSADRFDLYWCQSVSGRMFDSVIGRYGSDGPEYAASHPPGAFVGAPSKAFWYTEALKRGQEQGFYDPKISGSTYKVYAGSRIVFSQRGAEKEAIAVYEKCIQEFHSDKKSGFWRDVMLLIGGEVDRYYES